jgi:hypothetical protein
MKIAALLNGTLLSEVTARYALSYAKGLGLTLTFIFVSGEGEELAKFEKSVEKLEETAKTLQVETEKVVLTGAFSEEVLRYSQLFSLDTVFCGWPHDKKHSKPVQDLLKVGLETDLVFATIHRPLKVKTGHKKVLLVENKGPDAHAFLLFMGLLKGLKTKGKWLLQTEDSLFKAHSKSGVKYQVQPFFQIASMLNLPLEMAQTLVPKTPEELIEYVVSNEVDLMILNTAYFSPKASEKIQQTTPINTLIFYPWRMQ